MCSCVVIGFGDQSIRRADCVCLHGAITGFYRRIAERTARSLGFALEHVLRKTSHTALQRTRQSKIWR